MLLHATCVDIAGAGVLLRGQSGSGKSDLALRLIDDGAVLIADDQVELRVEEGAIVAVSPASIAGLLEVRGLGIVRLRSGGSAKVMLIADLVAPDVIDRMPEPGCCTLLGVDVRRVSLAPFWASAPAFVRAALVTASNPDLLVQ
jgi:HPr kinase/phosphorylase